MEFLSPTAQRQDGTGLTDGELHALVLHELSHLYFFGVAPAVMPDWYAEGFAESFGGQGSFAWDGTTLTLGGKMSADRLAALRDAPLPLRQLVDTRAAALLAADHKKGARLLHAVLGAAALPAPTGLSVGRTLRVLRGQVPRPGARRATGRTAGAQSGARGRRVPAAVRRGPRQARRRVPCVVDDALRGSAALAECAPGE